MCEKKRAARWKYGDEDGVERIKYLPSTNMQLLNLLHLHCNIHKLSSLHRTFSHFMWLTFTRHRFSLIISTPALLFLEFSWFVAARNCYCLFLGRAEIWSFEVLFNMNLISMLPANEPSPASWKLSWVWIAQKVLKSDDSWSKGEKLPLGHLIWGSFVMEFFLVLSMYVIDFTSYHIWQDVCLCNERNNLWNLLFSSCRFERRWMIANTWHPLHTCTMHLNLKQMSDKLFDNESV